MAVCKSTCLFFLLDIYAFQISANKWEKKKKHVFLFLCCVREVSALLF